MKMPDANSSTGHSPLVRLSLEVQGREFLLRQVAPAWVILAQPADLSPCEGVVTVSIDGREHRRAVSLPGGISANSTRVPIEDLPHAHGERQIA
ncbi:MAG: hypothetical protein WD009_12200 [Phycisphaeraceae bacterium]